MKIVFIITRADSIGGAQIHVRDLAQGCLRDRHDVVVLSGEGATFARLLKKAGIKHVQIPALVHPINIRKDIAAVSAVRQYLKKAKPDIVATHSSKAGIIGCLAAKLEQIPTVFTAHGWAFSEGVPRFQRWCYRLIELFSSFLKDKIICVSHYDYRLGRQAGISVKKLITVHNGIPDLPGNQKTQNHTKKVTVIMVGRFAHQKDHLTLLAACKSIADISIDLVGDGPGEKLVRAYVQKNKLQKRVRFLGYTQKISDLLRSADIFALISNWEGFPLTTLEAMRSGLPVIVSDVGGAAEAVHSDYGFIVGRGDTAAVQHALQLLAADPRKRKTMGQAARKRYEQQFSFDAMYRKTVKIYRDLC
jgi:glycosyltransferase involved in cell wall biosynthesis